MKTMLIIAAFLMTGASVYGLMDYRKQSRSRDFQQLYQEKKQPDLVESTPVAADSKVLPVPDAPAVKMEAPVKATTTEKKAVRKMLKKKHPPKIRLKEFSRSKLG